MSGPVATTSGLVSLLYRSTATIDFHDELLHDLVRDARSRNAHRDVTGALYFEENRFMQWLEGPAATVTRLFSAIGKDERHRNVEVMSFGNTVERIFGDWDLRLFRGAAILPATRDSDALLAALGLGAAQLRTLALDLARGRAEGLATELAGLGPETATRVLLCEALMRCYAGLWSTDACTEVDTVMGLALAQSQFRLHHATQAGFVPMDPTRQAMVAVLPGELHAIGATLAEAALVDAGVTVTLVLPRSSVELTDRLAAYREGPVVLVTSGVFPGRRSLDAIREYADLVRRGGGRDTRVALYGRLAETGRSTVAESGCHRHFASANHLPDLFRGSGMHLH